MLVIEVIHVHSNQQDVTIKYNNVEYVVSIFDISGSFLMDGKHYAYIHGSKLR